jgi:hypothetical protein
MNTGSRPVNWSWAGVHHEDSGSDKGLLVLSRCSSWGLWQGQSFTGLEPVFIMRTLAGTKYYWSWAGVHHEDWVFTLQQSFSRFRTTRQMELYRTWQKCLNGSQHCVVFLVYCTFPLWNLTCFLIGWNCYMEIVSVWMIVLVWCQFSNFTAISCREQVNFQWNDDDEVLFVLDQHAYLDFYSAHWNNSLQINMSPHSDTLY